MRCGDQEVRICVRKRICCRCGDGACNRPPAVKCSSPAFLECSVHLESRSLSCSSACGVLSIGGCRRHALSDFYSLLEVVAGSRSLEKCVPSLEMWWQRSHQ